MRRNLDCLQWNQFQIVEQHGCNSICDKHYVIACKMAASQNHRLTTQLWLGMPVGRDKGRVVQIKIREEMEMLLHVVGL